MIKYVLIAYAVLSVIALFLYAGDKRKAKKKRWRTPEAVLLGFGFFGGSVGALLGMKFFHHKTKHWYFWAVNILGLAWQVALLFYLNRMGFSF
jgi:uncharacterized membrane protein YsdA (DUF1294 family)